MERTTLPSRENAPIMAQRQSTILFFILSFIIVASVVTAYLPGLSSVFHFDDHRNLRGLADVNGIHGAISFVFEGDAGPTGRPLALLSFILQQSAWPQDPRSFLVVNLAIHILNGILVGFLAWLIAQQSPTFSFSKRAPWAALAVVAIWLALPLLASTSLFVIQRMTTLATLFILVGLCLHLVGRLQLHCRPVWGLAWMTLGILIGMGLGLLTKENAAVYPLLILILDRTLLTPKPALRSYRIWRNIMVVIPAALVVAYMTKRLVAGEGFDYRHFDLTERLLTQGVILVDYLRLLLLPDVKHLGPFHDHYPLYGGLSKPIALSATAFWFSAAFLALIFGRRWPIPAFGTLWFLSSHLIESTWLPLELYYEHRNYLPAVGLVLTLVIGLGQIAGRPGQLIYAGFFLYAGALLFTLIQITSLWGHPRLAAEIWWDRNPASVRAAEFLANYHLKEGFPLIASGVLDRTASRDPTQVLLGLRSMEINCVAGEKDRTRFMYESALERAPSARYVNRQPSNESAALDSILNTIKLGHCTSVDYGEIIDLASAFLRNKAVHEQPQAAANFYIVKAKASHAMGDEKTTLKHLMAALDHHVTVDTFLAAARIAEGEKNPEALDRVYSHLRSENAPWHLLERRKWQDAKDEVAKRIGRVDTQNLGTPTLFQRPAPPR